MAVLDDPDKREAVLRHLRGGGGMDGAGAAVAISRRSVSKYAKRNADFRRELDEAQGRGRGALPRAVTSSRVILEPELVDGDGEATLAGFSTTELLLELKRRGEGAATEAVVCDYAALPMPELRSLYVHRLCDIVFADQMDAKLWGAANRTLGPWLLDAEVFAARKRAEREESSGALEAARPDDADAKVRLLALVEARRKGADVVVG